MMKFSCQANEQTNKQGNESVSQVRASVLKNILRIELDDIHTFSSFLTITYIIISCSILRYKITFHVMKLDLERITHSELK